MGTLGAVKKSKTVRYRERGGGKTVKGGKTFFLPDEEKRLVQGKKREKKKGIR